MCARTPTITSCEHDVPPSVHKLTPFEKRLRRVYRLRAFGHEPTAPNCFWAKAEDMISDKKSCESCAKLRRKYPELNRWVG